MNKVIDKVALIEIVNSKILVAKSFGKSKYYIPGGKRDNGETDHQTLIRESKEELNIDIIDNSIEFVGIFSAQAHGQDEGVEVKMSCYKAQFIGEIKANSEIEDIKWVATKDVDLVSFVDIKIFNYLNNLGQLR